MCVLYGACFSFYTSGLVKIRVTSEFGRKICSDSLFIPRFVDLSLLDKFQLNFSEISLT